MSNTNLGRPATWMLFCHLFIFIMLVSGCGTDESTLSQEQIFEDVTVTQAFDLVQNSKNDLDFAILDVRSPEEFSDGHIENAISMDYNSENFEEELDQLDRSMTCLVLCKSGGRSSKAINNVSST